MVYRLPTPFDALAASSSPSPSHTSARRNARTRPWRGSFVLHGINLFQSPDGQQRLLVTSAETEGDKSSRTDLWPKQFDVHAAQHGCPLSDVQAWVTRAEIPLCIFMPDRNAGMNTTTGSGNANVNEVRFRELSRVLIENQLLCIAPWPTTSGFPGTHAGAGILIFPSPASTGLLTGAIFFNAPFPDFIGLLPGPGSSGIAAMPSGLPSTTTISGDGGAYTSSANFDYSAFTPSYVPTGPLGPGQGHALGMNTGHGQLQIRDDNSPGHFAQPFSATAASSKPPQMDGFGGGGGGAGDGGLRAAIAAAPFDWSVFDDTTDGSGSTSPGSTRTW